MHFQTHTEDHVVNTCCVHSLGRLRLLDVLIPRLLAVFCRSNRKQRSFVYRIIRFIPGFTTFCTSSNFAILNGETAFS